MPDLETVIRTLIREEVSHVVADTLVPQLRELKTRLGPSAANCDIYDKERLLSVDDAASFVGVRASTIRDWIHRGVLRSCRAGRLLRVRLADLHAYLARSTELGSSGTDNINVEAIADSILKNASGRKV